MTNRNWLSDFDIGAGAVRVRKTGAVVPIERGVVVEVATWLPFYFAVAAAAPKTKAFKLAFSPDRARPWYLIWAAAKLAGADIIDDPAEADVIFHFEDATISGNPPPARRRAQAKLINFECTDVSKSAVAAAFEARLRAQSVKLRRLYRLYQLYRTLTAQALVEVLAEC
jgi:hypothetical protein